MASIPREKWAYARDLYLSGLSMAQVAERLGVPLNDVTYVLRKLNVPRRTIAESNRLTFESKKPSFRVRKNASRELELIGAALYWGEGYKTKKAMGIDFANSDPKMAELFMTFLRDRYELDEKRIRLLLYCYSNQNVDSLIVFWSKTLRIPKSQFTRPYIRSDYRKSGRKIKHGLIHIRYSDKKLLLDVLNLIDSYKLKYCVGTQVVNEGTL